MARTLKTQMKEADRLGCRRVVILGEQELAAGTATVRNMTTGEQTQVGLGDLARALAPPGAGA
jgi:histidyl-tRNA synthetase